MEASLLCNQALALHTVRMEMRMSHWIEAPVLQWRYGAKTRIDLSGSLWHLDGYEDKGDTLDLILMRYPQGSQRILARIVVAERAVLYNGQRYSASEFENMMR
ncbi:MAG: hypothetical protein KKI09_06580 [Spirochaetes bacterium]|nr:hypothetical protein [Spirochaetota bacterium]